MRFEPAADVSDRRYDVVIVGAGIAGSIMAKTLAAGGRRVLVLEAGTGQGFDYAGYLGFLDTYYAETIKVPNSPYPNNPNAPQANLLDAPSNDDPAANSKGYWVQKGPQPLTSDYARQSGGTTLHWLGTCLRMLPEDFETRTRFGVGLDWPLSYQDLKPYYARAEREIGVSADIEDQLALQEMLGLKDWFDEDYVYPMHRIPQSWSDRMFVDGLKGCTVDYDGASYPLAVTSTPQGRNGMPNAAYPGGYTPVGAVGNPELGQRCQGNSACVPICPVQAKYNALKSLSAAVETGRVDVVTQAVASEVRTGPDGRIGEIVYKAYKSTGSPDYETFTAKGTVFVLACHAVETAKLLLASNIGGDAVGRYVMDHPTMLTWGLADRHIGTFRGPGSSSGIETLRSGPFRKKRAPFRVEIDNWGWNWARIAPWSVVQSFVLDDRLFGRELRDSMFDQVQREVRLGFLLELPPDPENRVTIDPAYRDRIGNYRPVISYNVGDYVRAGMAEAKRTSDLIYRTLGITDYTAYESTDTGYLTYEGKGYTYQGAGHNIGGHVMGTSRDTSVVGADQKVWGLDNLWLVGCGNMPTEGTSNPTLTMSALTLMAAERIEAALARGPGAKG